MLFCSWFAWGSHWSLLVLMGYKSFLMLGSLMSLGGEGESQVFEGKEDLGDEQLLWQRSYC